MDDENLDKLFQKKLSDFKATPSPEIWNAIEKKLTKKKRRVIPFWWFTGVAAIIVLGVFLFPLSSNKDVVKPSLNKQNSTNSRKENPRIIIQKDTLQNIKSIQKEKYAVEDKPNKKSTINKFSREKSSEKLSIISKKVSLYASTLQQKSLDIKVNNFILSDIEIASLKLEEKKVDIEKFINKNEVTKTKKQQQKNWSIAPVVALLASNSFSNTSPIDEGLSNSTEGENTVSYGVEIAYKINDRWTIKSGIYQQEMSYNNNQISVFNNANTTAAVIFSNGNTFNFINNNVKFSMVDNSLVNNIASDASLNQVFGYIEIPVEIKYNFSPNKKFETYLVTGFSSLFLNKNAVNLISNNQLNSGEAINLNSFNVSSNLGLDFNYLFNKKWSLHVNPMLKIQLNTFSNKSNNFAPFNIGVYSGIRYKF